MLARRSTSNLSLPVDASASTFTPTSPLPYVSGAVGAATPVQLKMRLPRAQVEKLMGTGAPTALSPSTSPAPSPSAPASSARPLSPLRPPHLRRRLKPPYSPLILPYRLYPVPTLPDPFSLSPVLCLASLDDDALLIPASSDLVIKRVPITSDGGGGGGESSNPHKTADEHHSCGRGDRGKGVAPLTSPLDKFDDPSNVCCPGQEAELSQSWADSVKLEQSSDERWSA